MTGQKKQVEFQEFVFFIYHVVKLNETIEIEL